MLKRKLAALSAAAVMLLNAMPVSAYYYDVDVSNPDSVINVRVNKPYFNFIVKSGDGVDISNMKFSLINKSNTSVAKFSGSDSALNVLDEHAFDFSKYHSAADTKSFPSSYDRYDDVYDLFTPDPIKGVEPTGQMYNAVGGGVISGNKYYLQFKDDYYYYYTDRNKFNIIDQVTVPANTIMVDTDAKYTTLNDKTTYFWLEPISSPDLVSDHPENLILKMYNVAGKTVKFRADPGTYHVRVNGGRAGGYTCQAYDHETTYLKVKMPFLEAFPDFCNSDLTIDHESFGNTYHYDLRGDQTYNTFSSLYYSGAAISASIPDADGNVTFWVNEDELTTYMEYDFTYHSGTTTGGGGGSVRTVQLPKSVEKINNVFEFPQTGYCIYNIQPAAYKLVLDDPVLARDYVITNNTVTVTNTKAIQKASFTVNKKPLLLGDCNRDGAINIKDVSIVSAQVKGIKKLDGRGPVTTDVDENGKINITDVSCIAAHVKGSKKIPRKYV